MTALDPEWARQRIEELERAVDEYAAAKLTAEGNEVVARAEQIALADQLTRTEQLLVQSNRRGVVTSKLLVEQQQINVQLRADRVYLINRLAHALAEKATAGIRAEQLADGTLIVAGVQPSPVRVTSGA